jgi:DNA polymerase (family X)
MKASMDKYAIAAALQEIGTLLELKGGQYFKARAYKLGARSVAELPEDLGKLIKENRLTFVKGIGYALAKQVEELYTTGESSLLNQLRSELPPGIIELSNVRGLNVKKIDLLHQALGISTIEDLKAAAEAGKLRNIKGFGAKTEQRILEAIAGGEKREQRVHIHHALRAGERILEYLKTSRAFCKGEFGGSLRRWQETVSQIVIVASAKRPKALADHFRRFPMVVRIEEETAGRVIAVLSEGFRATLVSVRPEEFPVALLNATGSDAHLIKLVQVAAKKKLTIMQKGNEKRNGGRAKSSVVSEARLRGPRPGSPAGVGRLGRATLVSN